MSALRLSVCLAVFLASALLPPAARGDGTLVPPGIPGSKETMMRTLNEVQPATPISALPYTITNSGAYVVVGNLTGTNGEVGITIQADNVTLDLNGFQLKGVVGALQGISVTDSRSSITIKNGSLVGWPLEGINASNAVNSRLSDLLVESCAFSDLVHPGVSVGLNSLVERCFFVDMRTDGLVTSQGCVISLCVGRKNGKANGGYGFRATAGTIFSKCIAFENSSGIYASEGSALSGCLAYSNGLNGIETAKGCILTDCTSYGNAVRGFYCLNNSAFEKCTAYGNGAHGVQSHNGSTFVACTAFGNGSQGIETGILPPDIYTPSILSQCNVYSNAGDGILAGTESVIKDSSATYNAGKGISAGVNARVENCVTRANASHGISVDTGSSVTKCLANNNTETGINLSSECQVIDSVAGNNGRGICLASADAVARGNLATFNRIGIETVGLRNLVIANTASRNSGGASNFVFSGNTAYGPLITTPEVITNQIPTANFSF